MAFEYSTKQITPVEQINIPFKEYNQYEKNRITEYLRYLVSEDVYNFIECHIDIISPFTKILGSLNKRKVITRWYIYRMC